MEFADFPWVPVVDGDFLHENAMTSFKNGKMKKTQLLAGSNLDEAIYFIVYQLAVRYQIFWAASFKKIPPKRETSLLLLLGNECTTNSNF